MGLQSCCFTLGVGLALLRFHSYHHNHYSLHVDWSAQRRWNLTQALSTQSEQRGEMKTTMSTPLSALTTALPRYAHKFLSRCLMLPTSIPSFETKNRTFFFFFLPNSVRFFFLSLFSLSHSLPLTFCWLPPTLTPFSSTLILSILPPQCTHPTLVKEESAWQRDRRCRRAGHSACGNLSIIDDSTTTHLVRAGRGVCVVASFVRDCTTTTRHRQKRWACFIFFALEWGLGWGWGLGEVGRAATSKTAVAAAAYAPWQL